jgi:hypothetical protein
MAGRVQESRFGVAIWTPPRRSELRRRRHPATRAGCGAHDAFLSQGSEERRKLLQLVVSNSTWKHGRLALELHAPFDLILKEASKAREADAQDLANGIKRPAFENWRRGRDLNSRRASDP